MDKRINIEAERELFEQHFAPKSDFAWRDENDVYKNYALRSAWEVWQVARATPPATGAMEDLPLLPVHPSADKFGHDWSAAEKIAIRQSQREAIAHYLRKQAGQAESADDLDRIAALRAAPASQHDAGEGETLDQKAENALLWCYRRLKNSYGRLPFVEDAVAGLRERTEAAGAARQGGDTNTPLAYIPAHIMESLRNGCRVGTVLEPKPDNGCTEALYG